ncbi:MAG: GIY-YIG nuclease family protein [Candidatus Pacebacteria bacterium]|jgi:putative endonuclease|nr:GIY-YIG nuclease family protein [Candidatus Paceibacterota bacterium]
MPRRKFDFYVYIMASSSGTLYIGVTNNPVRRITEHKEGAIKGFTQKYSCKKLVYAEQHRYIYNAIEREKEIKSWMRHKKEELIKSINPDWKDLSDQL